MWFGKYESDDEHFLFDFISEYLFTKLIKENNLEYLLKIHNTTIDKIIIIEDNEDFLKKEFDNIVNIKIKIGLIHLFPNTKFEINEREYNKMVKYLKNQLNNQQLKMWNNESDKQERTMAIYDEIREIKKLYYN